MTPHDGKKKELKIKKKENFINGGGDRLLSLRPLKEQELEEHIFEQSTVDGLVRS